MLYDTMHNNYVIYTYIYIAKRHVYSQGASHNQISILCVLMMAVWKVLDISMKWMVIITIIICTA